jgi:hypothetical protein
MLDPVSEARFWSNVDKTLGHGPKGECWLWIGELIEKGYGRFRPFRQKARPAHRVSWELANGCPWPEGKVSRHSCDYRPCVNPDHNKPGTVAQNNADMWERNRQAGSPAENAKKTHCLRGHPLFGENVFAQVGGKRGCKECRRQFDRKRTPARKVAKAAYDKKRAQMLAMRVEEGL